MPQLNTPGYIPEGPQGGGTKKKPASKSSSGLDMKALGKALAKVNPGKLSTAGSPNNRLNKLGGEAALKAIRGTTSSSKSTSTSKAKSSGYSSKGSGGGGFSSGGGGGGNSGGGGGGTGPSAPGGGTPDANGYLPIAADLFTVAPEGMLAELVDEWYPNEQGNGLYNMLKPYAEVANILFLAEKGNLPGEGTKEQYVTWLKDYFTSLKSTGFTVSPDELIANVLGAVDGSALAAFQNTGTPIENQQNTQQLLGSIYSTFYHPLMANSYRRQLDLEGARYIGESGKAVQDPFFKYIQGLPSAPMLRPGGQ